MALTDATWQTSGFTDIAPVVREQTVKAVLSVVGKLTDRTINGELLKFLARTANDEQPGIRTNTTICLGKIAKYLGQGVRELIQSGLSYILTSVAVKVQGADCGLLEINKRPICACAKCRLACHRGHHGLLYGRRLRSESSPIPVSGSSR